jgi:hypothetical protein
MRNKIHVKGRKARARWLHNLLYDESPRSEAQQ